MQVNPIQQRAIEILPELSEKTLTKISEESYSNLKALEITSLDGLYVLLLKRCYELKKLNLSFTNNPENLSDDLEFLNQKFTSLKCLEITSKIESGALKILMNHPSLYALKLDNSHGLFENCLELKFCTNITDLFIRTLKVPRNLNQLSHLYTLSLDVINDSFDLDILKELKGLQILKLKATYIKNISSLKNNLSLKQLVMIGCSSLKNPDNLPYCSSLNHIDISRFKQIFIDWSHWPYFKGSIEAKEYRAMGQLMYGKLNGKGSLARMLPKGSHLGFDFVNCMGVFSNGILEKGTAFFQTSTGRTIARLEGDFSNEGEETICQGSLCYYDLLMKKNFVWQDTFRFKEFEEFFERFSKIRTLASARDTTLF